MSSQFDFAEMGSAALRLRERFSTDSKALTARYFVAHQARWRFNNPRRIFMTLVLWIFRFAFDCHHRHLSRVFTIKRRTYQVCLRCGWQQEYSWARMHSVEPKPADPIHALRNSADDAKVPLI
jgi:hypothetical protein